MRNNIVDSIRIYDSVSISAISTVCICSSCSNKTRMKWKICLMTVLMEFRGETKRVELHEHEDLLTAFKIAAVGAFGIYMDEYEFRCGGFPVDDPERFDTGETFIIVKKSMDINVGTLI